MSGTFDLSNVACKQHHRSALNPILNGTKNCYGLFPLPGTDSDSDSDSCIMQDFSTGLDLDSDPLIQMYGIGTEICPWDGDLSLKWVQ